MNISAPASALPGPRAKPAARRAKPSWCCLWAVACLSTSLATSASQASAPRLSAAAGAATTGPALNAAPQMAGDVIVKFRDSSAPGAMLAEVLGGTRSLAKAAPLAASLSGELRLPLSLVRVTSGREALLAVDRKALLDTLVRRAQGLRGVVRASAVQDAAPGLPTATASVHIDLRPQVDPRDVAEQLARTGVPAPQWQTSASGATLLSYDIDALTTRLIQQLQARADVEYAQANRLLRAIDATKPR